MATLIRNNPVKAVLTTQSLLWLTVFGILAASLMFCDGMVGSMDK